MYISVLLDVFDLFPCLLFSQNPDSRYIIDYVNMHVKRLCLFKWNYFFWNFLHLISFVGQSWFHNYVKSNLKLLISHSISNSETVVGISKIKGCLARGCLIGGRGVCPGGVCHGGCVSQHALRQTHVCENITFPQLQWRTVIIIDCNGSPYKLTCRDSKVEWWIFIPVTIVKKLHGNLIH